MVTETVLVFGAGVSMSYGYPSGPQLVAKIEERLKQETDEESQKFFKKLQGIGPNSIDQFIKENPIFSGYAKQLISEIILANESLSGVINQDKEDNFYRHFVNKVHPDMYRYYAIITFNYDRSFEQFILDHLFHFYDGDMAKVRSKFEQLRIIHVHGRLPLLQGEMQADVRKSMHSYGGLNEEFRKIRSARLDDYSFRQRKNEIFSDFHAWVQKSFRFVDENTVTNGHIHGIIEGADRVFILGLSYHEKNLAALGQNLSKVIDDGKLFAGTIYKMPGTQVRGLQSKYPRIEVKKDCKSKEFFENHFSLDEPENDEVVKVKPYVFRQKSAPTFVDPNLPDFVKDLLTKNREGAI